MAGGKQPAISSRYQKRDVAVPRKRRIATLRFRIDPLQMARGLRFPCCWNSAPSRGHDGENPQGEESCETPSKWALVPVAFLAVACGKNDARKSTAMGDDLKRDLQLASQAQRIQISPDEIAPKSHQALAMKPKRAPEGPKVIRSEKPTIKASAMPVQAAEIPADVPQVQVVASSPTPPRDRVTRLRP